MSLKEKGAITGVGETAYSRASGKSVLALQLEASLNAIDDAGLKPTDIDGVIPYGRAPQWPRTSSPISAFPTCASRRPRRWVAPAASRRSNAPSPRSAPASATTCCCPLGRNGYSGGRIGTRVQQMPQFRIIGEFEMPSGRHRAGTALRADGTPTHGALRHHQPAVRRDRRDDAPPRAAQRPRHDAQADHRRGSSGLAHDLRSAAAVRLLAGERRRRAIVVSATPIARAT